MKISEIISNAVKEGFQSALQNRALNEKENQQKVTSNNVDSTEEKEVEQPQEKEQSKQPEVQNKSAEDKEKMKKAEVTVDDIIDKLNSIRSGKSFKDDLIYNSMKKYCDDELDGTERTALFAFLKGISQIVTGEFEPKTVVEPSDPPASVSMEKKPSSEKKSIKPNIISAPQPKSQNSSSKSKEDTSAPLPITPKKKL